MHLDVTNLRDFYYRTMLGRATQKALRDQVLTHWSDMRGLNVAGFGFAVPLLRPFLPTARRVIGMMPAPQGVMHWPPELPNHSVLVEETQWPIASGHLDRLVVMHGLETSDRPAALMEECYRSLASTGRLLIIVPNRRGLWARRDGTPFGVGRPYSLGQIEGLLKDHGFEPGTHTAALFFPPLDTGFWMRSSRTLEKVGRQISTYHAGGALIIEAVKQYPAPTRPGLRDAVRHPLRILDGVAQPGFRPAWRAVQRAFTPGATDHWQGSGHAGLGFGHAGTGASGGGDNRHLAGADAGYWEPPPCPEPARAQSAQPKMERITGAQVAGARVTGAQVTGEWPKGASASRVLDVDAARLPKTQPPAETPTGTPFPPAGTSRNIDE